MNYFVFFFCRHAQNTKDLKKFVITGLTGQRQGVKKLTAVTGDQALASLDLMTHLQSLVDELVADVTENKDMSSWQSRLKNIYQVWKWFDKKDISWQTLLRVAIS